jgi:membrane-associated phospholipid phosphatase
VRIDQLELRVLLEIRKRAHHPKLVRSAQLMGLFGEHAIGWIILGTVLALVDRRWISVAFAAILAHGAGSVIKRIVRRQRPPASDLPPLCRTYSGLSFPSVHACSTTAAMVLLVPVIGPALAVGVAVTMGISRLILGVHYPSDVLAGVMIGATSGVVVSLAAIA